MKRRMTVLLLALVFVGVGCYIFCPRLVVSSDSKLRIEVGKTKENYQDEAAIRGDGQMLWTVSTGDVVWIEKAKETFDMVRLGDASFFDKMRSKLNRN